MNGRHYLSDIFCCRCLFVLCFSCQLNPGVLLGALTGIQYLSPILEAGRMVLIWVTYPEVDRTQTSHLCLQECLCFLTANGCSCFPAEILRKKKDWLITYLFSSSEYCLLVTHQYVCLPGHGSWPWPPEANELLLWDTEMGHDPCQCFQNSYHPFHIEISIFRLLVVRLAISYHRCNLKEVCLGA